MTPKIDGLWGKSMLNESLAKYWGTTEKILNPDSRVCINTYSTVIVGRLNFEIMCSCVCFLGVGQIFGKAEFLNPGGSVKDRVAAKIIDEVATSWQFIM